MQLGPFLQAIYTVDTRKKRTSCDLWQLQTGIGQKASLETVLPSRDRHSVGGQNGLELWRLAPDLDPWLQFLQPM